MVSVPSREMVRKTSGKTSGKTFSIRVIEASLIGPCLWSLDPESETATILRCQKQGTSASQTLVVWWIYHPTSLIGRHRQALRSPDLQSTALRVWLLASRLLRKHTWSLFACIQVSYHRILSCERLVAVLTGTLFNPLRVMLSTVCVQKFLEGELSSVTRLRANVLVLLYCQVGIPIPGLRIEPRLRGGQI
jgi:hypothetical protein